MVQICVYVNASVRVRVRVQVKMRVGAGASVGVSVSALDPRGPGVRSRCSTAKRRVAGRIGESIGRRGHTHSHAYIADSAVVCLKSKLHRGRSMLMGMNVPLLHRFSV